MNAGDETLGIGVVENEDIILIATGHDTYHNVATHTFVSVVEGGANDEAVGFKHVGGKQIAWAGIEMGGCESVENIVARLV